MSGEDGQPDWSDSDWCPKCGGGYRRWRFSDTYRRSRWACLSRKCPAGEHLHRVRRCGDCRWREEVVTATEDVSGSDARAVSVEPTGGEP